MSKIQRTPSRLVGALLTLGETNHQRSLIGPKPWWVASSSILLHAFRLTGSGNGDMATWIAENPFQQGLSPCDHSKWSERFKFSFIGMMAHQFTLSERTHDDDAQSEIVCQWQDVALHLALQRIVGDLDSTNATRLHHLAQFWKRGTAVVCCANGSYLSRMAQSLQYGEVFAPVDE